MQMIFSVAQPVPSGEVNSPSYNICLQSSPNTIAWKNDPITSAYQLHIYMYVEKFQCIY